MNETELDIYGSKGCHNLELIPSLCGNSVLPLCCEVSQNCKLLVGHWLGLVRALKGHMYAKKITSLSTHHARFSVSCSCCCDAAC